MPSKENIKIPAVITISGITFLAILFLFTYQYQQQDDAYIFYTYAKNLAAGNGYVFNQGEYINATTSLLYTAILAGIHIILPFLSIPKIAHLIVMLSLIITSLVSMNLFRRAGFRLLPFSFPLLFIANPLLPYSIGLETLLLLTLLMIMLSAYCRQHYFTVVIVAFLAILTRPDALLFAFTLAIDYFYRHRRLPPRQPTLLLIGLLLIAAFVHYGYFNTWLPTTLTAKLNQTASGRWGEGWLFLQNIPDILTANTISQLTIIISISSIIYLVLFRRTYLSKPPISIILLWSFIYIIVYSFILNPPPYAWYYTPLAILTSLLPALLLDSITSIRLTSLVLITVTLFAAISMLIQQQPIINKYTSYYEAAEWLNKQASPQSSVASNEIGILGYFYKQGNIIDGLGLINADAAKHIKNREFDWYIHAYQPDYLVFAHPPRIILEHVTTQLWFQKQYALVNIIDNPQFSLGIYKRSSL